MSEQDTAEFPLPADATDDERAQAKREIGAHAKILKEEPHGRIVKGGPVSNVLVRWQCSSGVYGPWMAAE